MQRNRVRRYAWFARPGGVLALVCVGTAMVLSGCGAPVPDRGSVRALDPDSNPIASTGSGSVTPGMSGAPTTSTPARTSAPSRPSASRTTAPAPRPAVITANLLFDDFSYASTADPKFGGRWQVRADVGGPGVDGATWSRSAVTFVPESSRPNNRAMQLIGATDGTAAHTTESEVDTTDTSYLAGTYAARVRFTDRPTGPAGAHVYETFFTIGQLRYDNDPLYSEQDFEYLPAGGWGDNRAQLDTTTWHSYNASTDAGDRQTEVHARSYDGWHTLVMQVGAGKVSYYIDGALAQVTSGKYYPREKMAICFNLWFIDREIGPVGQKRTYSMQADWVYYLKDKVLSPASVQAQIDGLRAKGTAAVNSVA